MKNASAFIDNLKAPAFNIEAYCVFNEFRDSSYVLDEDNKEGVS